MTQKRLQIQLQGLLQGIGFRPFVYRLAQNYRQTGWVANHNEQVVLEIEGEIALQTQFLQELIHHIPHGGFIDNYSVTEVNLQHSLKFELHHSIENKIQQSAFVCTDIAVCEHCVTELFDPNNRRYRYPFISCCACGPRYSVIHSLPYDRIRTSYAAFPLCESCIAEYQQPENRRFFAQTIACADCGPQLSFYDSNQHCLATKEAALTLAIQQLHQGKIVALKSVGGFQLLVDATNQAAVLRLRHRKQRLSQPFALLFKSLTIAEKYVQLTPTAIECLHSPAAPIVLLPSKHHPLLAEAVAPQQQLLGVMLPFTPLHHLLMQLWQHPLVATSGNLHDEPLCSDNQQALDQLITIADYFLMHDRDIVRKVDDSVLRIIGNQPTVLRRARGYVPTAIPLKYPLIPSLALGGQLKNTLAINQGQQLILSPHLGDLISVAGYQHFIFSSQQLLQLYQHYPQQIITDLHPDYLNQQIADSLKLPTIQIQHHHAHILAVMAEYQLLPPVLGIAWDGNGLGIDRQLWGGEFLQINSNGFQRLAHLRPFALIGNSQAIRQPRRIALSLLLEIFGADFQKISPYLGEHFTELELKTFISLWQKKFNSPLTTSVGRLFDGFASLLNLCQINEFEAQAAMLLEQAAIFNDQVEYYVFDYDQKTELMIDWRPVIRQLCQDLTTESITVIATKLHQSLAKMIFSVIEKLFKSQSAIPIIFAGGCFQNDCLVQNIQQLNQISQYDLFFAKNIPPNDGGLAAGQLYGLVLVNK
jgi:hydrogenase maturation protein HypF